MSSYRFIACLWSLLLGAGPVVTGQPVQGERTVPRPYRPATAANPLSRTAIAVSGSSTGSEPVPVGPAAGLSATDSLSVFSADDFYEAVLQHNPIVRQASLLSLEAQEKIRQARGAFDPRLYSDYARKNFGKTLYYEKWQSGLTVPVLPGGIDLKLGYDRNSGTYLNPENTVPTTGLIALGVSVPLTQGLLIDARRNTLRQAQLATSLADADRLSLINKTLLEAAKTYWDWYLAYQQFRWIGQGYALAETRFRAVRQRALLGDAAAIDTTEALITVQDRQVQRQQAAVSLQNARLGLTAFLWSSREGSAPEPVDLPVSVIPQVAPLNRASQVELGPLLDRVVQQHPDLVKLANKQQQLVLEERFRRSLLSPKVTLQASLLSRGPLSEPNLDGVGAYGFQPDNHKIGVDLAFPLFLRAERGKLRQVQLQNQQTGLEKQQTGRTIVNEVQQAWNELLALEQQIGTHQQALANQHTLVRAEVAKFQLGESSLFLVNSRETKLIDYQVKLEELRSKHQKAFGNLWYTAGTNVSNR